MSIRLKALLTWLCFTFIGITITEATEAPKAEATHPSEQPKAATWLERTHNSGTIDEDGGKVGCTMRLVNTTDSALSIIEVRSSCGCTAVHYPKQPIEPGDTASLNLVFNPKGRPGRFSHGVAVRLSSQPSLCGPPKLLSTAGSPRSPVRCGSPIICSLSAKWRKTARAMAFSQPTMLLPTL